MIYSISISGNGAEVGIKKLTKAQYDFWSDEKNEAFLKNALMEDYSDIDESAPEEIYFETSYHGLCDVLNSGGGYENSLTIEISPVDYDEDDIDPDDLYSFDDDLSEFINDLSAQEKNLICNYEEFETPKSDKETAGYLIWEAEETGTFLEGEIEVDSEFDINKLRLNFSKINKILYLKSVQYDGITIEQTNYWDQSGYFEAEIVKA
jgi:hypothetical protein